MAVSKSEWILAGIVVSGVLVRILWVVLCPPIQVSDYAIYIELARSIVNTHSYLQAGVLHAYIAPGEPALMAAGIYLFGDHWWVPAVLNICCYLLLSLMAAMLAIRIAGERAGIFTTVLLAIWPTYLGLTGLAASEHPAIVLFFAACMLPFVPAAWAPVFGIAAGLAALTRPNMMLLPTVWIAGALLNAERPFNLKKVLLPTAVATFVMLFTIAPWTIRNYYVLHAFVPISTNGGDVFYRANNSLANGTWTKQGEIDFGNLYLTDEVKGNKVSYAYGERWIAAHPDGFMKLAVRKAYIFLRSDDAAYWPLARAYPAHIHAWHVMQKIDDSGWLLLLAAVVLTAVWRWNQLAVKLLILPALYLLAIHSIYESQGRYHIPAVPFLIILVAVNLLKWARPEKMRGATHE